MNRLPLVLLAALLALALPSLAAAGKPPKPKPTPAPNGTPTGVTIKAAPSPVTFNAPVSITGRVAKGGGTIKVTLQKRTVPATTFSTVGSAQSDNNGTYTLVDRPVRNTTYRVLAATSPASQSPDLLVKVAMYVGMRASDTTPARGSRVRFSGIVRPSHNGRTAYVQKLASGNRWVTVGRATLRRLDARSSRYSRTLRVRNSGSYRVRVLGHADHAMGISRVRVLTVH